MTRITNIAVCVLASLAAVGNTSAQDHAARVTVPFGFFVGSTWVPAGTYTMTSESRSPNIVAIRNGDSKVSLISLGQTDGKPSPSNQLVFNKYGDQYFLREIQCSTCGMNVAFPGSKRERRAQALEAIVPAPTQIYLALKLDASR